jgi:hypothetical protein
MPTLRTIFKSPPSRLHTEGKLAKAIEKQTAKLPSDTFLWAAMGSILLSLFMQIRGRRGNAVFIGQWAPVFLLLGVYNKMVKQHGHEWW